VAYNFPTSIGEFTASTRISYNSGFNHEIFGLSKQSAYTLVNAGLAWESPNETFNARVDVSNLFNQEYSISGNVTDTAAYYVAATPRVVMFTVGTKF
jgi:TonB dependent receptor.